MDNLGPGDASTGPKKVTDPNDENPITVAPVEVATVIGNDEPIVYDDTHSPSLVAVHKHNDPPDILTITCHEA